MEENKDPSATKIQLETAEIFRKTMRSTEDEWKLNFNALPKAMKTIVAWQLLKAYRDLEDAYSLNAQFPMITLDPDKPLCTYCNDDICKECGINK